MYGTLGTMRMLLRALCVCVFARPLHAVEEIQPVSNLTWNEGKVHKYMPPYEDLTLLQTSLDVEGHVKNAQAAQLDLLKGLKDLIKSFEGLDKCLNADPKYKIMPLLDFFTSRLDNIHNPGAIWSDFQKTYVDDAMNSAMEWTKEELANGVKKIQAAIIDMQKGKVKLLDVGHIATLIDEVWAIQDRLLQKKGFLPLKCLDAAMIAPHKGPLKKLLVGFVDVVLKPVVSWFEDIMKKAMEWISGAVSKLGDLVGWDKFEKRLAEFVAENAAESCLGSINEGVASMMAAKANNDFAACQEIHKELSGKLPVKMVGKITAAALSLLLSDLFAAVMDKTVEPIMEWVLGALSSLLQTTLHGVNGVCGLIPEAGDAVCALITNAIDGAQAFINDHLGSGAVKTIQNYFKNLVSYKTLEPPIMKALGKGMKMFKSEMVGLLKNIGIPGGAAWVKAGMHAIGEVVEKLAAKVLPRTLKSLKTCKEARNKAAETAEAFSKRQFVMLEMPQYANPGMLEILDRPENQGAVITTRYSSKPIMTEEHAKFEAEFLEVPLFAGATMSLDDKFEINGGNWIFDLPFQPQPEHAEKWKKEHASLLQEHEDYVSGAGTGNWEARQREASMVEVTTNTSLAKVWPGRGCIKESWKYDKWGKNELYFDPWPIPKLRWKFGWKHMNKGQCEFGNNAWHLFNWWCPKSKSAVEQGDMLNPGNFDRCFDDENWVDQLLKTIDMLPNILKVIDTIKGCMNNLEGDDAKWKIDNIIKFYADRAADPVRLIREIDSVYLAPTMKALDPWFHRTISGVMKDGMKMLDQIIDGNLTYDIKWAEGVVAKGWSAIADEKKGLVSVKGMGALKCLKNTFGVFLYNASKNHLAQVVLHVVKPAAQWLAGALKKLEEWFQEKVSEAMDGDDWFAQITRMVRAAITKTCMDKYLKIDFANARFANARLELFEVGKNLVAPFFEKVKLWAIYHVVDPLAKALGKASREVANMIMHGVDALSGLIPFWGGLVGMLASSAGAVGKRLESTFSYKTIVGGFEQLFSLIQKGIENLVKNGIEDVQAMLVQNPVGKIVLTIIQRVLKVIGGPLTEQCTSSITRLAKLRNVSAAEFKKWKKNLITTTTTPAPTPKPTPRPPTPKPTPAPTPYPEDWSQCWENQECLNDLGGNVQLDVDVEDGNGNKRRLFRRRNNPRDNCIYRSCLQRDGQIWDQSRWKDCGHWKFAGWCKYYR